MKKNVNKILTLALALVVVAAMAGCGSTNNSSSSSSSMSVPPSSDTASSLPETSSSQSGSVDTGSEYDVTAQKYLNAITGARAPLNTTGDPANDFKMDVFTSDPNLNMNNYRNNFADMKNEDGTAYTEDQMMESHNTQQQMQLDLLGLKAEDLESYALSVSPMNTQAHGIAVVKPVAGKEETVKAALETYVQNRAKAFEGYLQDQYELAKAGYVKTLEDGTLVMVISESQDTVYENLSKALMAK